VLRLVLGVDGDVLFRTTLHFLWIIKNTHILYLQTPGRFICQADARNVDGIKVYRKDLYVLGVRIGETFLWLLL
jgi:hypothetical protein